MVQQSANIAIGPQIVVLINTRQEVQNVSLIHGRWVVFVHDLTKRGRY